jgi:hypothetical protein
MEDIDLEMETKMESKMEVADTRLWTRTPYNNLFGGNTPHTYT